MNGKVKKILNIVVDVILGLFVVFALFTTILAYKSKANNGVPALGNTCLLTVQSDSMSPTFKKGDLIFGKKISDEQARALQKDDVISFYFDMDGDGKKEINTHRIIYVDTSTPGFVKYITQGDNNEIQDTDPVYSNDVISVWKGSKMNGVGAFVDFLQEPTGFLILIVLPMGVFFAYELIYFIRLLVKMKNDGKRQITAEDEEEIKRKAVEEYLRQMQANAGVQTQTETAQETPATEEKKDE